MNGQYLTILLDGLRKKLQILDEIQCLCNYQGEVLSTSPVDYEAFDRYVDDKDVCITQLTQLDEGFEQLYGKVREELQDNKEANAQWIREAKDMITQITEKSVSIQTQESRNKLAVENAFRKEREKMGKGKKSMKAAMDYYRSMNRTNVVTSQYMDKKK